MESYRNKKQRLQAIKARDALADKYFVYGVLTTRIVCYPSCASREALAENMRLFDSVTEAVSAGFRYCKRCRTDLAPLSVRHRDMVVNACRLVDNDETLSRVDVLAQRLGVSRFHLQKVFKEYTGVSPKSYMQAVRAHRMQDALATSATITQVILDAGYDSLGSFYADVHKRLGMNASTQRSGANDIAVRYGFAESQYGLIVVAKTEIGICAVLFGETRQALEEDLSLRFPKAQLNLDEQGVQSQLQAVIQQLDEPDKQIDIPLDIRGTVFQEKVWKALCQIPCGQTASYAQIAKDINQPKAARAVAKACSANPLAVLVPCHRVVKGSGDLSGYRWGVDRKRALLDSEQ